MLVIVGTTVGLAAPMPAVLAQQPGQQAGPTTVSGKFGIPDELYATVPLLVGLNDASGLFGIDPDYIAPKDKQMLGTVAGNGANGSYTIQLPDKPIGRSFDVTGSNKPNGGLEVFDVRLMTDVASRGYQAPNEDEIASTLNLDVEAQVQGGTLLVWAADDKQPFPTDFGADKKLFTADDPRITLPAGWTLVNLDASPFQMSRAPQVQLDLITSGGGARGVDFRSMNCAQLVPAILNRAEKTYPFTKIHHIDWEALKSKLDPQAQTAPDEAGCERLIRDIGNAIPDSHVNFNLPALRGDWSGSAGLGLSETSDGQAVVSALAPKGPAANAGVKLGAVITAWNGQPVSDAVKNVVLQYTNKSTDEGRLATELSLLTRGPVGSSVQMTSQNPGEQPQTVSLQLVQAMQMQGVNTAEPQVTDGKLPSGIGYFRLPNFAEMSNLHTLDATVDTWIKENVTGAIIDIRNNGGGLSQISDAMESRFYDFGFVIGRNLDDSGRVVYLDQVDPRQPVYKGCMALLVNLNSVSAADQFAYGMQLHHRAIIVGHSGTSGGGGSVNGGLYEFLNGAFLQIPTGSFYNDQNQIVIEGQGVQPDVKVPLTVKSLTSSEDEVLDAAVKAVQSCASHPATP